MCPAKPHSFRKWVKICLTTGENCAALWCEYLKALSKIFSLSADSSLELEMKLQNWPEKQGAGPVTGCNTQPIFTAYESKLCSKSSKALDRNAFSERRFKEEFCLKSAVVIEKGERNMQPSSCSTPQENVHSDSGSLNSFDFSAGTGKKRTFSTISRCTGTITWQNIILYT